jgi:hypothetical protein
MGKSACVLAGGITSRAADGWDGSLFSGIFHPSGFSCSQAVYQSTQPPLTQTVGRTRPEQEAMQNLLPCPFCGSAPEVEHIGNDFTKSRKVKIRCPQCRIERTDGAIIQSMAWLENIAAEHWNSRPTLPAPDKGDSPAPGILSTLEGDTAAEHEPTPAPCG